MSLDSRAFETTDHNILIRKLASFNLSTSTLKWLASYSDRRQIVLYNNTASDPLSITHGVPQGSILGPLLSVKYINDLFSLLPYKDIFAYTDDVTMIASGATTDAALVTLQSLLEIAFSWSISNHLSLNLAKCLSMIILTKIKQLATCLTIKNTILCISDFYINNMPSLKLFGVLITSDLSWRKQTRSVCSQMARKLSVLCRISISLDTRTRAHIFNAHIKLDLDFCLPVWCTRGLA